MKKINMYYWVFMVLVIGAMGIGSVIGLITYPNSTEQFTQLGYPAYLAPFLDVARILALITLVFLNNYPRLKEWAFAGLVFDVVGAIYSQLAAGKPFVNLIFPVFAILFLCGAYVFYHKKLKLTNTGREL